MHCLFVAKLLDAYRETLHYYYLSPIYPDSEGSIAVGSLCFEPRQLAR